MKTQNGVAVKSLIDEKAYGFMVGFFSAMSIAPTTSVNLENLYNSIDHKGNSVYGPVVGVMKQLEHGNLDLKVWLAMH